MRNGVCVQSKSFRRYQRLGDPVKIVDRLSDWASDELIYLDISDDDLYDLGRDDLGIDNLSDPISILEKVAQSCFMPLTFGGRIRTIDEIEQRIHLGADKVSLNTQAHADPNFIDKAARQFGNQCIVVCVDAKRIGDESWSTFVDGAYQDTKKCPIEWAKEVEGRGAGEILLQSIDEDGVGNGYDLHLIEKVVKAVNIPVIALGGVGDWSHFVDAINAGANAVAAANIFNYSENSVFNAKQFLYENGCNVRQPTLGYSENQVPTAA